MEYITNKVVYRGSHWGGWGRHVLPSLVPQVREANDNFSTEQAKFIDGPKPNYRRRVQSELFDDDGGKGLLGMVWGFMADLQVPARTIVFGSSQKFQVDESSAEFLHEGDTPVDDGQEMVDPVARQDELVGRAGGPVTGAEKVEERLSGPKRGSSLKPLVIQLIEHAAISVLYFDKRTHTHSDPSKSVEMRRDSICLSLKVGHMSFRTIDDGGLRMVTQSGTDEPSTFDKYVAVFDLWTEFSPPHNGERFPIGPDRLANMVCGAIMARHKAAPGNNSVFYIHMVRHWVRFIQVDVSNDFIDNLHSLQDHHAIHVYSTAWLNFETRVGRLWFVQNLSAIDRRAFAMCGN